MKMKNLVIIFILFLLITLGSGLVVFLTQEKSETTDSEQSAVVEKQTESVPDQSDKAEIVAPKKNIEPKITELPEIVNVPVEEKIKMIMIISGAEYEAAVKPGSSVYDLMDLLKTESKIDFFGKNYSGLGFFVEEINGLKNNPAGENWIYYVNGQPAQIGASNYLIEENDVIEWKYENKSF